MFKLIFRGTDEYRADTFANFIENIRSDEESFIYQEYYEGWYLYELIGTKRNPTGFSCNSIYKYWVIDHRIIVKI